MSKVNTLRVGDAEYALTREYREGALAARNRVAWACNPYRSLSEAATRWEQGHTHETEGLHRPNGLDVISAPRTGACFHAEESVHAAH